MTANSSRYANELSVIMGISRLESLKHGRKVGVLVLYPALSHIFIAFEYNRSSCDTLPSLSPTKKINMSHPSVILSDEKSN